MTTEQAIASAVDGLLIRPFDVERDYPPVAALVAEANVHDGLDWFMTENEIRGDTRPGGHYDPIENVRVAQLDSRIVGVIRFASRERSGNKVVHRQEIWVAPAWRRRGVGRRLAAWAEEAARQVKAGGGVGAPTAVHEMALTGDEANGVCVPFAEALGYRLVRYSFEMRRRLDEPMPDAPLPPGLELRPVVEADHRRVWEANAEAFQDHWEAAQRTDRDFDNDFADPAIDTSLWKVAWDGDEVAGVSINTIFHEENERLGNSVGWLDQVSVRRPWRRRGVGAALIAASLRELRARGIEEAALGVDAENPTGALRLYESLGFRRHRSFRVYRKTI